MPSHLATRAAEPRPRSHRSQSVPVGLVLRWWRSRYGARLLREVVIVVGLLSVYRLGRTLGRHEADRAFANAHHVLRVEDLLGIDTERSLQHLVLDSPTAVRLLNRYYAMVHFPVSFAFLAFVYVLMPQLVSHVRYVFVSVTAAALVIHLAYPLAPPRMLHGYVDTVARYGPSIYERSDVSSTLNQYAAMPSLHFGWAVLVAYGLVVGLRTRWRWLAVLHPVATLAAIVLTANHYWLDALVAVALIALTLGLAPASARLPLAGLSSTSWCISSRATRSLRH